MVRQEGPGRKWSLSIWRNCPNIRMESKEVIQGNLIYIYIYIYVYILYIYKIITSLQVRFVYLCKAPQMHYGKVIRICVCLYIKDQPQWLRGLRYEIYLLIQTIGSSIIIPVQAWTSVFILFGLFFIGSSLVTSWSPVEGDLPIVHKIKELKWNGISRIPHAP
jgi:hypothetical protein